MRLERLRLADIEIEEDFNCRSTFMSHSVSGLAESLDTHKQMFPVLVGIENGQYYLIAGFRRCRALKILKEEFVWAIITDLDLHTARVQNLCENIERKQLSILDEAQAIVRIFGRDPAPIVVSEQISRKVPWVKRRIKLMTMHENIQQAAHSGRLTEGQLKILQELKTQKAQLKRLVRMLSDEPIEKPTTVKSDRAIQMMMVKLCELGVKGLPLKLLRWCRGKADESDVLGMIDETN